MKHKRRNPLVGPLVTVILMISSIVAIGAIAHLIDLRTRGVAPTVVAAEAAVREGASQQSTRKRPAWRRRPPPTISARG